MEYQIREAFGESEPFMAFQHHLGQVARVDRSVLVIGERGSGKELAASRLHFLSPRWNKPFIALNCAALAPGLMESELFGHESGAFTGAADRHKGRFEEADGGTLFLDEIGIIPIEVQEKILRTVEYGTFQRVGSSHTVAVDVRIIGATNQNLPRLCADGVFKYDLLDRLSFEVLFIPPLRMREDDILMLAEHFVSQMAEELGRTPPPVFSSEVKSQIARYSWPGNIRELKNTVERAVYREEGSTIQKLILNPFQNPWMNESSPHDNQGNTSWPRDIKAAVRELEVRWLNEAMEEAQGHQGKAAKMLGLNYDQLRRLYRKYR